MAIKSRKPSASQPYAFDKPVTPQANARRQDLPAVTVEVGQTDTRVICSKPITSSRPGAVYQRGSITCLTPKSRNRMVQAIRNAPELSTLVTLTYPAEFPHSGKLVKQHWDRLLKRIMYRYPRACGVWILEFQKRGAPHYHVFFTCRIDKKWLSKAWYQIVGSGDEKHLRAGVRCEAIRKKHAPAYYAAKYGSKLEQKEVPENYTNVGRFWAFFGRFTDGQRYGARFERLVLHDGYEAPVFCKLRRVYKRLMASKGRRGTVAIRARYQFWAGSFYGWGLSSDIVRRVVAAIQLPASILASYQKMFDDSPPPTGVDPPDSGSFFYDGPLYTDPYCLGEPC